MKIKPLWRISIATTPEAEDAVAEMLGALSCCAASAYHSLETGNSTVTVYGQARPLAGVRNTILAGLAQIKRCGLKVGRGKVTVAKIRREDWAESWKRHFQPIEIAGALLIKPSWSKRRPRKNQAVVVLDPGLSFGTGQHPTTSFCLREIARCRKPGTHQSFLDIGTGSGILAIAACKLGYQPVSAFDFDPGAVRVARGNARANRVHATLRLGPGDVTQLRARPARKFDLVCANLISDLLIAERRRIAAQLNRGGTLVAAGILKSEFQKLESAFEDVNLKLVSSKTEMEWRSGSFRLWE
jgi:ribosomal protein L11 methyltransferase